jgi:ferredoxin-type protein NapF
MLLTEIRSLVSGRLRKNQKTDLSRRLFIGGAAGAILSLAIPRILKDSGKSVIRPPAALSNESFWSICTRCGSCIKACPTDILVHDNSPDLEFLTPRAEFVKGYCLETCNNCSKVCPSGAITSFEVAAKPQIIMGLAVVNIDECLLTLRKECDRCKAVCPYNAVGIIERNNSTMAMPEIVSEKCVGCGACKVVCPAECIKIVV